MVARRGTEQHGDDRPRDACGRLDPEEERMRTALGVMLATLMVAQSSQAATYTGWGRITLLVSGRTEAAVRFVPDGAVQNPDGCTNPNGYKTDPSISGTELFNSILLSAYALDHEVQVVIDGCYDGRPRIVEVHARRP